MVRESTSALRTPSGLASPLPAVLEERFPALGSPDCDLVESFSPEQARLFGSSWLMFFHVGARFSGRPEHKRSLSSAQLVVC